MKPLVAAVAVAVGGTASFETAAQRRWLIETGVSATLTASDNADLAPRGQERADATLQVSPRIALIGQDQGRVRASGAFDLGATLVARARGDAQANFNLRPQGRIDANLEPIENFFFVDAGLGVTPTLDSPFLATTGGASAVNTSTTYQAYVSPRIQGNLGAGVQYTVRSDHSWTDSSRSTGQYSSRQSALIERAPQPLGGALSFEHSETSAQRAGEPDFKSDLARAIVRYAPIPEIVVGVRGGAERNNYALANEWETFHGAEFTLRPTERTQLDAFWEKRFFGDSWSANFTHRMPRLSFTMRWSRDAVTTTQQFVTFPALANLVALLDAALITRVPDPIERQRIIIDFLSRQQLPPNLLTPVILIDDRVSVQSAASASAVLLGVRNSLALSVFQVKTIGLAGVSSQLPAEQADNKQLGAELTFSHNLTPSDTLSATTSWRKTEGLQATNAPETTQTILRLQVSSKLGAHTNGFVGARYQWIESSATNDAREAAVFAGIDYRF